eukprot:Lankesteria_metandrocarpae@DN4951_c0_g1_i1.p1
MNESHKVVFPQPMWLSSRSGSTLGSASTADRGRPGDSTLSIRTERLMRALHSDNIDLAELRKMLWSGIPEDAPYEVRSLCWKIALGHLPTQKSMRSKVAKRRLDDYLNLVNDHFGDSLFKELRRQASSQDQCDEELIHNDTCIESITKSREEARILRQIRVDLPRTRPTGYTMLSSPRIYKLMERVLYCWSIRHPASGYVQGINDLLTPFIVVFLRAELDSDLNKNEDTSEIPSNALVRVEADSFWCLARVLGYIQDHYTFGQPGIQRSITQMKTIVRRIDEPLYNHIANEGVDFLQFAFRWMNCLLLREFPTESVVRLWDTYIAEGVEGFSVFHVYVCCVFLVFWSPQLRESDFQQIMLLVQKFPTDDWDVNQMDMLLSEAFVLKSLFHSSPNHLEQGP